MLGEAFRGQRAFLAIGVAYVGWGAIMRLLGWPINFSLYSKGSLGGLGVLAGCFLIWRLVWLMGSGQRGRPTLLLIRDVRRFITWENALRVLPAILILPMVLSIYTSFKVAIPALTWDADLAAVDRAVHGDDVWRLLHPMLGHYWISYGLAEVYSLWFLFFQMVTYWQVFGRGPTRQQFLISFVLCWGVFGVIGGRIFASAGPVFYERLLGLPDFAELTAYVHKLPQMAYEWQDGLWLAYSNHLLAEFGRGISAMPSLHVTIATLNALVLWRCRRWLGIVASAYAFLVALASVHLGWHYAVDTYAGAIAAIVIWFGVGAVLKLTTGKMPEPATQSAE